MIAMPFSNATAAAAKAEPFRSATALAQLVQQEQCSPTEIVQQHLCRIEALHPHLNAFAVVDGERALDAARGLQQRIARGEAVGPLAGVPVSIKSSIDVAGMRCDAGSRLRQDYVAAADAPLVARLRAAGAIVMGVTNTPGMLMSYDTENVVRGRTLNPWDAQ